MRPIIETESQATDRLRAPISTGDATQHREASVSNVSLPLLRELVVLDDRVDRNNDQVLTPGFAPDGDLVGARILAGGQMYHEAARADRLLRSWWNRTLRSEAITRHERRSSAYFDLKWALDEANDAGRTVSIMSDEFRVRFAEIPGEARRMLVRGDVAGNNDGDLAMDEYKGIQAGFERQFGTATHNAVMNALQAPKPRPASGA